MKHLLPILLLASYCLAQSGGLINGTRGVPQANEGTTGTVLNLTATVNSSGQAITTATSQTTLPARIVVGGAGTTGNAVLASTGTLAPCTMDTTIASGGANNYVVASTITAGQCHPQSAAPASGTWIIGFLHDAATTSGLTALVHVNGFVYGGTGGTTSGSGTVAPDTIAPFTTGTGYLTTYPQVWHAATNYYTNQIIRDSNNNLQRAGANGTSQTPGPPSWNTTLNGTTNDGTITWTNVLAASPATVTPVPIAVYSQNPVGLILGAAGMMWGAAVTSPDTSISRLAPQTLIISNQFGIAEGGYLRSNNSCALTTTTAFTATKVSICSRSLPSVQKAWIVHCAVPWAFATGNTGTATVTLGVNFFNAPFSITQFSGVTYGTGTGPVYVTAAVNSGTGSTADTVLYTASLDSTVTTVNTTFIDGVFNAPATSGTAFTVTGVTSAGTANFQAGAYCRVE